MRPSLNVTRVAGECLRANLPLVVEALPCPSERIPDPKATEATASAARLGFEHGADLVKSYYTEDFSRVTENCPVPVLIAGGPRMETIEETLQGTGLRLPQLARTAPRPLRD